MSNTKTTINNSDGTEKLKTQLRVYIRKVQMVRLIRKHLAQRHITLAEALNLLEMVKT